MSVWRSSRGVRTLVWVAPLVVALGLALAGCKSVQQARPAATQPPGVTGPVITTPGVVPPPSEGEAQPSLPPVAPGEPNAPAAPGQPVRVALLLPLTGPYANFGRALLDAATLALFDLGDDRLVMLPRDTQSTPSGAAAAAQAALNDGAQIVLGPLLSAETATVAPLFRERGVNVVSFSSDRSVAGSGVYIMGFTPGQEVNAVVDYAHAQGLNRFAVLAPESPYGNAVRDALQAALGKVGGELVKAESYPADSADLTPIVRRFAERDRRAAALEEQRRMLAQKDDDASREALKRLEGQTALGDAGFDALLLPEGGARLKALAPLLAYYDVDPGKVRFLGTGLWDDPGLGN
ncbi:MAG TPA: penicillin-binding protein activator [Candidatus Cybelea sp.]|nr:penicillin-binding protein activator [Candidatus Cybelea sp.]